MLSIVKRPDLDDDDSSDEQDNFRRQSLEDRTDNLKRRFTSTYSTGGLFGDNNKSSNQIAQKQIDDDDSRPLIDPPPYPIHLAWTDLQYSIAGSPQFTPVEADEVVAQPAVEAAEPKKRCRMPCGGQQQRRPILQHVTGEACPGELMVILGPSGAGKSTLMNILSGRVGNLDGGTIHVNGELRDKRFKRHTAFVLQEDLFFASLTVRQTLTLTGQLLLRSGSEAEKIQRVENMISLFKLDKSANTKVGDHVSRGLSGGEKKRLNIANELLCDPSLIFLDEPSSGLDAVLTDDLVTVLSFLAKSGRTLIATLHQPSSRVFQLCDKLLLMAEGGRVAYFGPTKDAVPYFSRLNFPYPPHYNPADYVLELVQHHPELPALYQKSLSGGDTGSEAKGTMTVAPALPFSIATDSAPPTSVAVPPPLPENSQKWPIGWARQTWLLGCRALRQHSMVAMWNCIIFIFVATIGAIVWWDRDYSIVQVADRQGLMFFVLLQYFLFPMFDEINSLVPELPIITKERRQGMYRLTAYAVGKSAAELILDLASPVLFTTILYWSANLNPDAYRFFTCIVVILIAYLLGQSIGFILAALIGNIEMAAPLVLVVMFVSMLTSGFYASLENIPTWFSYFQYWSPLRYLMDSLIINEFATNQVFYGANTTITGFEIVEAANPIIWNGEWVSVWYNILVMIGVTFVFRLLGFYFLSRHTSTKF